MAKISFISAFYSWWIIVFLMAQEKENTISNLHLYTEQYITDIYMTETLDCIAIAG